MRSILLVVMIIFISFSVSIAAADKNGKDESYKPRESEKRYEDLKDQFYELKYDLRQQIHYQNRIIDDQAELITEMRLKIKELESNLFQTTQSLRNLEIEVWDMKKSADD